MQKDFNMAALHVKIAAKLSTGFNQSKTQRALVEAFLGNHQQVCCMCCTLLCTKSGCGPPYTHHLSLAPREAMLEEPFQLFYSLQQMTFLVLEVGMECTTNFMMFLLNQAITLLREMPVSSEVYSLMGKIQFKARMFPGAAESFKKSIDLKVVSKNSHCWQMYNKYD